MLKPVAWGRAALTGAALLVGAGACDSVLGIEEPQDRPTDGGEAGEPPSVAGTKNMGGSSGLTTPEGGAAGTPEITVVGEAGGGGGGGAPPMPECEVDDVRCGGDGEKTPEVCDETGHFVENGAECPVLCAAGECVECEDEQAQCTPCEQGQPDCNPRQLQTCNDGVWRDAGAACEAYCANAACINPPSCNGAGSLTNNCDGASCCRSLLVPGGTFKRDYDGGEYFNNPNFPAQISSFFLDKFEVTVGRMRAFVSSYDEIKVALKDGDGKAPHIEEDEGWSTSNDLPADKAALIAKLNCVDHTWADDVLTNNYLPISCVPFYVAYAFCIWDGGRLPTNAEWNFAASGGDEQRLYPWKAPADGPPISADYAYYGQVGLPTIVGSTPLGNGRWGQADLAGNVYEWALDYHREELSTDVCVDCLEVTAANERTLRGGAFYGGADLLFAAYRNYAPPNESTSYIGFRCARDAK